MNTLELRWRAAGEVSNMGHGDEKEILYLELWVDGAPLRDVDNWGFSLGALLASTEVDGALFIITCTCGDPGCAGIGRGVDVQRRGDEVHWEISEPYPYQLLFFDRRAYFGSIKQGIDEGRRLMDERKRLGGIQFEPWPQSFWLDPPEPSTWPWHDEALRPLREFEERYERDFGGAETSR